MNMTIPELVRRRVTLGLLFSLFLGLGMLSACGGSSSSPTHHHRPTPTLTPTATPTPGPGITGSVYGGSPTVGSPISGAQVTLYQAGSSGYGSAPLQLAQVTSSSDGGYNFPAVACQPTGYSQQIYLLAAGGTIAGQSAANSAIVLSAGAGSCADFAHVVVINEVTTVATVWALDQFMDPTGHDIGTSSTNPSGLSNAATAMISYSLVDLSTGIAPESFPDGVISPTAALYSLANILSGCVNSSGAGSAGCQNLFTAATPSGGLAPLTTLAAALDIARNPLNNVGTLFNLVPASPPFTPGLTSEPVSWTLTVHYEPSSAGLSSPYSIALDSAGNVWAANASGNSVSELTSASGYTAAQNFEPSGAAFNLPSWLAFDTAGNLWVSNLAGNSVSELTTSSNYTTGYNFTPAAANLSGPTTLAFDSAGNLWVSNYLGNSVGELFAGCTGASCSAANFNNNNTGSPGALFSGPVTLAPDAAGDVWVTNYASASVTRLLPGCSSGSCTGENLNNSNTGSPGAEFAGPSEVHVNRSGNAFIANKANNSVSDLPAGCTSASCNAVNYNNSNTGSPGAAFNGPVTLAIDASDNIWVANYVDSSVSELTAAGCYLAGENFGPWQFFLGQFAIAADAGGNLWIANNYDDSVSEVLGVATPILTPISACLALGQNVCLP
jgi:streptogramin lyase